MAMGNKVETRGHVTGFQEEIGKAAVAGKDSFFSWFNTAADADAAFVRGSWDFAFHIAGPLGPWIDKPENKTALEIGYGGGRILASACRSFKDAIGVDIHGQSRLVGDELKRRGVHNFKLIDSDGCSIPLESGFVDVAYSFIVLQHVEKIAVLERYFEEAHRVLKPGGVAMLYFGRRAVYSHCSGSWLCYALDRLLEAAVLRGGYLEMPAAVNDLNLLVSLSYAKRLSARIGFKVLGHVVSRKNVPDGVCLYGAQHGVMLRKE